MSCDCSLVFRLVGRVKETRDAASEHNSYYWSLVNSTVKVGGEREGRGITCVELLSCDLVLFVVVVGRVAVRSRSR